MDLELFILNGYGLYVWPAFIFAFLSCFYLYIKTKKEFLKQEKIFLNKFKELQTTRIKVIKKETAKKGLSTNFI
jgi:heme exporter protein D